jgi:Brp/Blh family beta-carotene 15,15'-monooxygenase
MMSKTNFLFIALFYLLFAIFSWVEHVDISVQLAVSGLFLLLVGIPHGAIDHILFLDSNKVKPVYFYGAYLGLMMLYVVLWFFFPFLCFVFFLLMSAYHFGQSQFSELYKIPNWIKQTLYVTWGVSILSGLLLYNMEELTSLFALSSDLSSITVYFDHSIFEIITISTSALTLFIYGVCAVNKWVSSERIATELYLLLLIHHK